MGWSGGSQLADDVYRVVRPFIPADKRRLVALRIIVLFEAEDVDTMDEAETLMQDSLSVGCDTCGEKPGTPRTNNGLPAGTHCDACWQQLIADARKRSW